MGQDKALWRERDQLGHRRWTRWSEPETDGIQTKKTLRARNLGKEDGELVDGGERLNPQILELLQGFLGLDFSPHKVSVIILPCPWWQDMPAPPSHVPVGLVTWFLVSQTPTCKPPSSSIRQFLAPSFARSGEQTQHQPRRVWRWPVEKIALAFVAKRVLLLAALTTVRHLK